MNFNYVTPAQNVVFGAGTLKQIGELTAASGWNKLMLCTTRHLRMNGQAWMIEEILGERLVATYEHIEPHVPDYQVAEALKIAAEGGVDAFIGLGGGSPIGMAKALSLELEALRVGVEKATAAHPADQPHYPCIAIPTTYAGSEMTPVYGVTRVQEDGSTRKVTVRDFKITPKLVIYDPALTLELPKGLTATTGINSLAHCIEAVYSKTRNPLSTSVALRGIYHITRSLETCVNDGQNLEARTEMQTGAHLGGMSLATVLMGLHHGTGHVLGGTAGVPHGVANCIVLPHAMRFNADVLAAPLALVAEAMGIERAGKTDEQMALAAADFAYELISKLGAPQRLRDVDVPEEMLPKLAENMLKSSAIGNNPKPIGTLENALAYLQQMY